MWGAGRVSWRQLFLRTGKSKEGGSAIKGQQNGRRRGRGRRLAERGSGRAEGRVGVGGTGRGRGGGSGGGTGRGREGKGEGEGADGDPRTSSLGKLTQQAPGRIETPSGAGTPPLRAAPLAALHSTSFRPPQALSPARTSASENCDSSRARESVRHTQRYQGIADLPTRGWPGWSCGWDSCGGLQPRFLLLVEEHFDTVQHCAHGEKDWRGRDG